MIQVLEVKRQVNKYIESTQSWSTLYFFAQILLWVCYLLTGLVITGLAGDCQGVNVQLQVPGH